MAGHYREPARFATLGAMRWRLLDGVPEEDVKRTLALARRRTFARDEVIFHEADPGDCVHLIESGRVAVRIVTPHGQRATLAVIGPGEAFGELALLGPDARRTASIVTLEPTVTHAIHGARLPAAARRSGPRSPRC